MMTVLTALLLTPCAFSEDATSPGSPPKGDIQVSPAKQVKGSTLTIAIGKQATFTAANLSDTDGCEDGIHTVTDSIKAVKWEAAGGSLGDADKTTATFTAPNSPTGKDSIAVSLSADDQGDPPAFNDGDLIKVDSIKVDVVLPDQCDTAFENKINPSCFFWDPVHKFGVYKMLRDTVAKAGCTVDFETLQYREEKKEKWDENACDLGDPSTGGETTIGANNVSNMTDDVRVCEDNNFAQPDREGCVSKNTTNWQICSAGQNNWKTVWTRTYTFTGGKDGKVNNFDIKWKTNIVKQ